MRKLVGVALLRAFHFPFSYIKQRLPDVHLQNLALHFDRPDENPDLVAGEFLGVRVGQGFKLLRHRRVLVGGGLKLQPRFLPGGLQSVSIAKLPKLFRLIRQQQAEPRDVLDRRLGL